MAISGFLSEEVKVTIDAATATGTSTITSTIIDMAGWDGVCFFVRVGSPAVNNNIRVQQDSASNMAAAADIAGSLVGNHGTNNPLVLDVLRPKKRYVRVSVARGTTTTIESVVAIQYRSRTRPTSQPSGLAIKQLRDAAEGTA